MEPEKSQYAGFWLRVGATFIDAALYCIVALPILLGIYGTQYFDSGEDESFTALLLSYWTDYFKSAGLADALLTHVVPALLLIWLWRWKQATPGNLLTRTRIVDANTLGALSTGQCILRYIAIILAELTIVGLLWIAWDRRKQGLHDKLARTLVVRAQRESVSST